MQSNSSSTRSAQKEDELVQLNTELQRLEEEADELVAKVNEQRLSVPHAVLELFSIAKEARLSKLENLEPKPRDVTQSGGNIDKAIDDIVNSTSHEHETAELEEYLRIINRKIEDNQRHSELLYTGLTRNPGIILPEACYLTR